MNLKLITTLFCLLSTSICARGVLIQCWEKGATQSKENIVYQNDGGYIYKSFVSVEGVKRNIVRAESEECLSWDFPRACRDIVNYNGLDTVDVILEKTFDINQYTKALEGTLYEVEILEVFCKRRAL